MSRRELEGTIARIPRVAVSGRFQRHTSLVVTGLTGIESGGRWGPPRHYSVLYLGRPRASVIVEAYRHLVDPLASQGMTGAAVEARQLLICAVNVTDVLDLRAEDVRRAVAVDEEDLCSPVGSYRRCWQVGEAAYGLGLHGILAPSATELGETLALFVARLSAEELPRVVARELWDGLPPDPRRMRLVDDSSA